MSPLAYVAASYGPFFFRVFSRAPGFDREGARYFFSDENEEIRGVGIGRFFWLVWHAQFILIGANAGVRIKISESGESDETRNASRRGSRGTTRAPSVCVSFCAPRKEAGPPTPVLTRARRRWVSPSRAPRVSPRA